MMKFLAYENILLDVVRQLQQKKVDIVSLSMINPRIDDKEVLDLAQREQRVLITFDQGFGELIFKAKKPSNGIILLRIQPQTVIYITSILEKVFAHDIDSQHTFCIVEINRIRVVPFKDTK